MKWGRYNCQCEATGETFSFVGPGNLSDPTNLWGVSEVGYHPLPWGGFTVQQIVETFSFDPNSRLSEFWRGSDFINAFRNNNQEVPK